MKLPEPISTYFDASNASDMSRALACFHEDARVYDEGRAHDGIVAIRLWAIAARDRFDFQATPLSVATDGDTVRVVARVQGTFPGSPIELQHAFLVSEERIKSLHIG